MHSFFSWVDFSEEERQEMMELLHILNEHEIREELGLGSIRDAFSDILFPGTSVLQTRAKYMLLVPWIFLKHERRQTSSEDIAASTRYDEIQTIFSLIRAGEKDGVLGSVAKHNLKILPSSIYWTGLGRWGIRLFNGSLYQYFRSLDSFYFYEKNKVISDDKELVGEIKGNWNPSLPVPPKYFPEYISLSLKPKEAEYLHDRILASCSQSLLAFLVDKTRPTRKVPFVWFHPRIEKFPKELRKVVYHAQNFSEVMHSAALLYNLMLSEKIKNEELIEKYRKKLVKWAEEIEKRFNEINKWDLSEFWDIARAEKGHIPFRTVRFVEEWIQIIKDRKKMRKISDSDKARRLVYNREVSIKGNRSRLKNPQMLKQWSGTSAAGALDFRWKFVQRIVKDILYGLKGNKATDA